MDMLQIASGKKSSEWLLLGSVLAVAFAGLFVVAVLGNGTGGEGDSVMHFLYAKWSWQHPECLLNHWAKPVFTTVAAPFALAGLKGVKLMNLLCWAGCVVLSAATAKRLGLRNALLAGFVVLAAPEFITATGSGLTEPLFACWLMLAVWLWAGNRAWAAVLLVSFLPFIRNEGFILLGVFGHALLLHRQYKMLPGLAFGTLAVSVAGWAHYGTALWVFTKVPYIDAGSYGSGNAFDFVIKLWYALGIPGFAVVAVGVVAGFRWLTPARSNSSKLIVLLGFVLFFVAHSAFWAFNLFHSMGLKRVLICIIPLGGVLAAGGIDWLEAQLRVSGRSWWTVTKWVGAVYLLAFPLTPNPAAVHWQQAFTLSQKEQYIEQAAALAATYPTAEVGACSPYALHVCEVSYPNRFNILKAGRPLAQVPANTMQLVIWDNGFAKLESGFPIEVFSPETGWKQLAAYPASADEPLVAVFLRTPTPANSDS